MQLAALGLGDQAHGADLGYLGFAEGVQSINTSGAGSRESGAGHFNLDTANGQRVKVANIVTQAPPANKQPQAQKKNGAG